MNHLEILEVLNSHGHEAYIVGGAVRDRILGLPVKDYDLATSASPETMLGIFSNAKPIFSHSGAPVVSIDGYEVASFRKDTGMSRHGTTFVPGNLYEDAARRDFTINALYETRQGQIVDPTGQGQIDIELRRLRFIGDAEQRILEDPLRILRYFRILAQKQFHGHDFITDSAILVSSNLLDTVASEQIGRELRKLLSANNAGMHRALRLMQTLGVMQVVLPEVAAMFGVHQNVHHQEGDCFEHTMRVLDATAGKCEDPNQAFLLAVAALFHDTGKVDTAKPLNDGTNGFSFHDHESYSRDHMHNVADRLPGFLTKKERCTVHFLVQNHMRVHYIPDCSRKKSAALLRDPDAHLLLLLAECDTLGRIPCAQSKFSALVEAVEEFYKHDKTLADLGISGKFLVEDLGQEPGPVLGEKLKMMTNILDKNPHKTRAELLQAVGISEQACRHRKELQDAN